MNKKNIFILAGIGSAVIITMLIIILVKRRKKTYKKVVKPKNILIIGDSISSIYSKSSKNLIKTQWSYLLKENLKEKNINVDILALGGMASKWMLGSLKDYLEGKEVNTSQPKTTQVNFKNNLIMSGDKKYDIVIIYTGVNDAFGNDNNRGYKNVQEMVDIAKKMGAKVYVVLGYEQDNNILNYKLMTTTRYVTTNEAYKPLVENYIKWQKDIPTKINGASFIPKFDLKGETRDGTHPSVNGHKIIKDSVLKSINI